MIKENSKNTPPVPTTISRKSGLEKTFVTLRYLTRLRMLDVESWQLRLFDPKKLKNCFLSFVKTMHERVKPFYAPT